MLLLRVLLTSQPVLARPVASQSLGVWRRAQSEVAPCFLPPLESVLLSVHVARGSASLPTRHGPGHPGLHLASRHLSASGAASAWGGSPLARCSVLKGIPWWLRGSRVCLQCGRPEFHPRGGEEPLEKKMATHSRFLACLENPTDGGACWATRNSIAASRTGLSNFTLTFQLSRADSVFCSISSSCNSGQPGPGLEGTMDVDWAPAEGLEEGPCRV